MRSATPSDLPLIHALADRIWWAHYPSIISEAQIAYMLNRNYGLESLQRQMGEGQDFWILEEAGEAFGFIGFSQLAEGSYFMHKFYIDPSRQGSGAGSAAFAELLEKYPDIREIRLLVNRQNYKSVNFYFKMGFIIEKCLETPIGEGFVMDDFQMIFRRS